MNRIILYILAAAFLFANSANSQLFNSKTKNTALKSKVVAKEASPTSNVKDENQKQKVSPEDVEAIINKELSFATITPEQKSEISLAAKKNMRVTLDRQSTRDRRDFIDVITNSEKVQARRKALVEGKSVEEAKKLEDKIKLPEINPKNDADMEKYMHLKAGLLNE